MRDRRHAVPTPRGTIVPKAGAVGHRLGLAAAAMALAASAVIAIAAPV